MNKPNGYDETKASGTYIPIELGGHHCVIKRVAEMKSKNGKDMIVVLFDFTSKDKQPNYFTNAFNEDVREEKKWPFAGTKYIMVNDYNDSTKTSRDFKTFCTCVEKSNPGFVIQWGNDWGAQFNGKLVGINFGREESEYNNEISFRTIPRFFVSDDKVETTEPPRDKLLKTKNEPVVTFTNPVATDDIPF